MQPKQTRRRISSAYLVHVCVRTDAADVLRLAAGAHFLSAQTQTDEKRPFASPRWRCPKYVKII
jgi:hypothetical protein